MKQTSLNYLLLFTCLFLMCSCEKETLHFKNFDAQAWKADRRGCESKRKNMIEGFRMIKDSLIGISEEVTMATFGKPDQIEVYPRGQRFYYYMTEKGKACEGGLGDGKPLRLRFSATNHLTEVTLP